MSRIFTLICLISLFYSFGHKGPAITFKENKNQWPKKVSFAADLTAGQVFIEKNGLTWKLYSYSDLKRLHDNKFLSEKDRKAENETVRGHVYKVEFVNAQFNEYTALEPQPEYYNYFLGNDPKHWASKVKAYEKLKYKNVYKNIDAHFYGTQGNFEYDLILKPGADVSQIKLNYQFTKGISLVKEKLVVQTSIGDVTENIPEAYQIINSKKVMVDCHYVLTKNEVSFKFGNYDPKFEVIIDPVVVVSSYSGTESVSYGLGLAPDSNGEMYLYSLNVTRGYPITTGVIQTTVGGTYYDCTLSKFNATGTAKRFSTYIGGNSQDIITNCVIQNNEIAVFGYTRSDTFPIINSGFQTKLGGIMDYFLLKLDTSGSVLLGSTYLGGSNYESASTVGHSSTYFAAATGKGEMIMDRFNNCYVIGASNSDDYPTTPGAYRMYSDSNGASDMVITKINRDLTHCFWSTYYGGSYANSPAGLRLSRSGKLYCGGTTISRDFPTTPGVVYSTSVSTQDMVAFILDTLSGYPIASTYLGAKGTEALRFDIDQNDHVYMVGYCLISPNTITVTPGAYNSSVGRGVLYKVDPNLAQINAIGRFGYSGPGYLKIEIDAMNVDSCGYIYIGGFADPSLPTTAGALKADADLMGNIYFAIFNPGFSALKYASYFGGQNENYGDHDDGGLNYFDDRGCLYMADCVEKMLPTTPGAYFGYNNVKDSISTGPSSSLKNSDAFVKIDLQTFVNVTSSLGGQIKSCSAITQTFVASSNLGSVTIDPGDGTTPVVTNSLVYTYSVHGTYTALVISDADQNTCNVIDSVKILVKYGPPPVVSLEDNSINCDGATLILDAGNPGSKFIWNSGDTTQSIQPQQSGKYIVVVDNGFCRVKDSTIVTVEEAHNYSTPNAFTPNGDNINETFCLKGWKICNESFKVRIFDRWGEKVFESEDPDFCWDGKYKGSLLSADVYIYHIVARYKGDREEVKKGNITLIR